MNLRPAECCQTNICLPGIIHLAHSPCRSAEEEEGGCFWLSLKTLRSQSRRWPPGSSATQQKARRHFRPQAGVAKQPEGGASCGAHLRAGGVGRAPGPLAPRSTLAAELLSAMLSHSLQQQVVDGGEMIVAGALQRLRRTEQINDFAFFLHPTAAAFPSAVFNSHARNIDRSKRRTSQTQRQTRVRAPQLSFGGRSPACS